MPSINQRRVELVVLITLGLWGLVSAIQGAGLSFFVYGPHQFRDETFIELVYCSVISGVVVSLISARLAAILSCIATVAAVIILHETNTFGHGAANARSFLWAIAVRPALASVFLFLLPPLGPLVRHFTLRKSKV